MPRQALITLDHIKQAAATLTARGQSITNRSLREIVGFGSFDTISRLRKQLDTPPVELTELEREEKEGYRDLWLEAASECAVLREELGLIKVKQKPEMLTREVKSKQYEVFKHHFEGKMSSEIATLLDLPISTVWTILNR